MSDLERLDRAKREADEAAYKRGFREGVDVTMWAAFFVALAILMVFYWA